MCTSLTYGDNRTNHFLARTMDFSFELNASPVFLPRRYKWNTRIGNIPQFTKFAIMGAGSNQVNDTKLPNYLVADAFNEHGLAVAELYFENEAIYDQTIDDEKLNLVSEEFIMWILGNHSSIEEVRINLNQVSIQESDRGVLGKNQPLHWILTDKTGETVVIEPRGNGLFVENNPVGVMTNSPELEWHLKNLGEYPDIQPNPFKEKQYGEWTSTPSGMGSGTKGIPGGYLPSQRFIRTTFIKQHIIKPENSSQAVNNIIYMLSSVMRGKNVVLDSFGGVDYTQYLGVLDVDELAYYFIPNGNFKIYKVRMTQEMISSEAEPFNFENSISCRQEFDEIN